MESDSGGGTGAAELDASGSANPGANGLSGGYANGERGGAEGAAELSDCRGMYDDGPC